MIFTPTVTQCIEAYLSSVALSRSANTTRTYRNAMRTFTEVLLAHKLQPDMTLVTDLHEEPIVWKISFKYAESFCVSKLGRQTKHDHFRKFKCR